MKTPLTAGYPRSTAAILGLGAFAALAVAAQAQTPSEIEALRAEMRTAREAYENRIAELERRLSAVERAPAAPAPGAPPAPPADTPAIEQRVAALERATKENSEALEEVFAPGFVAEGLPEDATRNFEFHGYLRAGYGINQSGGGQQRITHPDGLFEISPGRLGAEPDTYGELTFRYNFPADEGGPQFSVQSTLAYKYLGERSNYTTPTFDPSGPEWRSNGDLLFREAFITATNVFATAPDLRFWIGQRFYDRHDIHVHDYYFLDMSGYGGGVENIVLGPGKLAVAYLGGTRDSAVVDNRGNTLTKQAIDIRWSELPAFGGKGLLWVAPMYLNGGPGVNPDSEFGVAAGWVQMNTLSKGYNKWSIQYGYGPASQFNTYVSAVDYQPTGTLEDAETFQFTNQTVWQFSDQFSLMGAVIVNYNENGSRGDGWSSSDRLFVSAAVRPIYMFTKHLGLTTEVGVDWADDVRYDERRGSATLGKVTVAGIIKPSGAFWTRPELRAYVSYFRWMGEPGYYSPNGTRDEDRSSWNFGLQAETWW
jgi:maltoporin